MDKYSPARSTSTKGSNFNRWSPSKVSVTGGIKTTDSRDLIITQLKREINDIKASERDVITINSQLSTIEHKYRLLQDEKNIQDREFKTRTEQNMRRIAQLKSDHENALRKISNKSREFDNLMNDLKELESLSIFKQQELEKSQANFKETSELKRGLEQDIATIRRKIKKESDSKAEVTDRIGISTKKLDDLLKQNKDCDTEIAGLEEELRQKTNQKSDLERQLDSKNKELALASEMISQLAHQVEELQHTIDELDQERESRRRERENINSQLATLDASIKRSEHENHDIEKRNHQTDIEIRKKNVLLAERQSEVRNLAQVQDTLKRENGYLRDDIEEMKTKIRELMSLNREVVNVIAEFNTEDEQIISELDYQIFPARDLVNQSFRTASIH